MHQIVHFYISNLTKIHQSNILTTSITIFFSVLSMKYVAGSIKHVSYVSSRATQELNLLHCNMYCCSTPAKKKAFRALALPTIYYGILTTLRKTFSLWKCGVHWVCGSRYNCHVYMWSKSSNEGLFHSKEKESILYENWNMSVGRKCDNEAYQTCSKLKEMAIGACKQYVFLEFCPL